MVTPEPAAFAIGEIWHRRNRAEDTDRPEAQTHEFRYPVQHWWLDPDRPEDICRHHWYTSTSRPAPFWFRRKDYFDGADTPIGPAVRELLTKPLGYRPVGPIRMVSQPRTWGWLFNPITVYLVWGGQNNAAKVDAGIEGPAGAVLEVTNTPWKERHFYPVALEPDGTSFGSKFDKKLHVSPFLGMRYAYRLTVGTAVKPNDITISLAVVDTDSDDQPSRSPKSLPIVETELTLALEAPSGDAMKTALYRNPFPAHRVSLGIHRQAFKLWRKQVPFLSHPKKQ